MISPIYTNLAKEHTTASFLKIDVDDLPEVAQVRLPGTALGRHHTVFSVLCTLTLSTRAPIIRHCRSTA